MATTRQLCRLLGAHLGVDVVPHAAHLVRAGLLSRRDGPVDPYDVAHLLVAVLGAPTAEEAVAVVDSVMNLPLDTAWSRRGQTWSPAMEVEKTLLPIDPIAAIANHLDETSGRRVTETVMDFEVMRLAVVEGGRSVTISGRSIVVGNNCELDATYTEPRAPSLTGMSRLAEIHNGTLTALAKLLRDQPREATAVSAEPSMLRH